MSRPLLAGRTCLSKLGPELRARAFFASSAAQPPCPKISILDLESAGLPAAAGLLELATSALCAIYSR